MCALLQVTGCTKLPPYHQEYPDSKTNSFLHAPATTNIYFGRDGEIRTRDPFNPIEVRYLAALRPVLFINAQLACNVLQKGT